MGNEACIDLAYNLKKPVAVFTTNESFFERFRCAAIIQSLQIAYAFRGPERQINDIINQMNIKAASEKLPQSLPSYVQYPPLIPELSNFMSVHKRVLYVVFGTRFFTTENNNKILQSLVETANKKNTS
ncbi:hypothetical protein RhiirC2_784674 [Rhizophagus irregularis]|uniref:Uncharacterized protein n=1 Tax=Rhizophagus irregularis TaxID=588596 RepID=A0A2N1MY00_9GLOM|nr:hypothetical protein RhiirC2_784674 [Rhizophagus irregularis]